MRYLIFDRSRHEDFEKCPRLRLIQYEYPVGHDLVSGIQKQALAIPLLTGATVHKGLESFVTGIVGQGENEAVQVSLDAYDADFSERGLELDAEAPDPQWTGRIQRLLCEALIRGWIRCVWPKLQAEFDVVDVEQEERLEIALDEETVAVLLTRSDIVMQRKADGRHFVFNHKTINEPTIKKLESLRYDTQSISEVLAAQARYDAKFAQHEYDCKQVDCELTGIQIDGVIYDLLVKGPRKAEYPKGSGVWHNNSPLIWCYVKEGQTGISEDEIAARYEYNCTAPHQMYRKVCPGGANHKLGPHWHRKPITEVFHTTPVLEWFQWLEQHEPGLVEAQFQTLAPVMRSPFDVERWKRSVLSEEWGVADRAVVARKEILDRGWREAQPVLDTLFPLHTAHGNCFWPGKCPMWDVCWGTGSQVDELLLIENNEGRPMYAPRKHNHPEGILQDAGE